MTTGPASESEVEDEESSPVVEASSPTTNDASKLATAPLTTPTSAATTATGTSKDGDKEGRKFYIIKICNIYCRCVHTVALHRFL